MDFLFYLIIAIIFGLLWNRFLSKILTSKAAKASKAGKVSKAEAPVQREPDFSRTKQLFNMALWKLVQKNQSDLLMADYHIRTKVGSPETTDLSVLERQLQSVLMELLAHLHLMPDIRLIVTRDPAKLVNQGAMGEYHSDYNNRQIRLLVSPSYSANDVVAALCHECSHYFAYSCGIAESDRDTNEGLTDTLSILLGFSESVLSSNNNRAFPYLNGPEFRELKKLLLQYREAQKSRQAQKQELASAREQLRKNIAGASGMIAQAQAMISVKKMPEKRKRMSRAELAELQSILLEFESGSFSDTLNMADKVVNGSFQQVRQADYRVLDICAKTYKLMLAFR